ALALSTRSERPDDRLEGHLETVPVWGVRSTRDRYDAIGPQPISELPRSRVRDQAAGGAVAADEPGIRRRRGVVRQVRQPRVPLAVLEQDLPDSVAVEPCQGIGLGPDV